MSKEQIRIDLELLSSEELLDIWNSNDRRKYKREAFIVIRDILTERGIDIPPENLVNLVKSIQPVADENAQEVSGSGIAAYFKFESLISPSLIRISYLIGMLMITYIGYKIAINSQSLTGAAILLFGNLLWRIVCEGLIIFFRIHESLVSIDKKL